MTDTSSFLRVQREPGVERLPNLDRGFTASAQQNLINVTELNCFLSFYFFPNESFKTIMKVRDSSHLVTQKTSYPPRTAHGAVWAEAEPPSARQGTLSLVTIHYVISLHTQYIVSSITVLDCTPHTYISLQLTVQKSHAGPEGVIPKEIVEGQSCAILACGDLTVGQDMEMNNDTEILVLPRPMVMVCLSF